MQIYHFAVCVLVLSGASVFVEALHSGTSFLHGESTAVTARWRAYVPQDQATKDAVHAAATKWIATIDAQKYEESWNTASTPFKNAVAKGQWITVSNSFRTPLGDVISRKVRTIEFSNMLPNLPPGEYAAVTNETAFATKPKAIELIVLVHEADGAWRVLGYWINDPPPGM